ncbi:hypothetical protein [Tabrizicola sp.]|uniref:hypothetical protein n=1 Tax=Tabrizicola sp. TaxID=2005166 RepID=UPI0027354F8B|nr:hypothetical protein [Tabrizicola sp.]MDP3193850.1 hypothetical protein [Tabrizicola sp.]
MIRSILSPFLLALGLIFLIPVTPALADCHEDESESEEPDFSTFSLFSISCHDGDDPTPGQSINSGVTKGIVKILNGANSTCGSRIELRYRIDCLRLYYLKVAANLPNTGDYLPIKQAMLDAADKLDAIVTKYEDQSAPILRPREGHKSGAKRLPKVRPVKEAFAEAAAVEAAMVVEEAELIIIRSGGDPARRTQAYTDVATAVEENLVILRSA